MEYDSHFPLIITISAKYLTEFHFHSAPSVLFIRAFITQGFTRFRMLRISMMISLIITTKFSFVIY